MKASEMLTKINALLSIKVNLAQLILDNGTIIESESFAGGESVFIVTDDERVALPIGEYMIEDGRKLVVSEEGIIESIGEGLEKEDEKEEEVKAKGDHGKKEMEEEVIVEVPDEAAKEVADVIEAVVEVVSPLIEEIKEEVEELKKKFETVPEAEEEGYKDGIKDEKEDIKEKLSKRPARKPINHSPERRQSKVKHLYSQKNKGVSTLDRVLNKLNNFK
jgi:hypothetical protein